MAGLRRAGLGVVLAIGLLAGGVAPAVAADPGTLEVTPSTDLVDDQVVQVTGEGWPQDRFFAVFQCLAGTGFGGCDETAGTFIKDGQGSFSVELEVERQVRTLHGATVDCASAPGTCVIALFNRPGRALASVPLAFDPEGPPPDPELEMDFDIARSVRLAPDGNRALVETRVTCQPGMRAFVFVTIAQDQGEDRDVFASGEAFLRRCHGTTLLTVEVRTSRGEALEPGHAVAFGEAFGSRPDEGEDAFEFEFLRVSLGR